jgi:hypothetical protein
MHKHLDDDIEKMKNLNKEKRTNDPEGFRVSKLLDLLTQSKKYIDFNWSSILDAHF